MIRTTKDAGIYIIENVITGAVYIGSSGQAMARRFYRHKVDLRNETHPNERLQRAWKKYGEDAFIFKALEAVPDRDLLLEREQYWIDRFRAERDCYNLAEVAGTNAGVERTAEWKRRISEAQKRRWARSPELRQQFAAQSKDWHADPANRKRVSERMAKTYPGFVAPDGTIYRDITNLQAFCAAHGLNDNMHKVLRGRATHCHGWVLYDDDPATIQARLAHARQDMQPRTYAFIAPDGTEHRNITNVSAFCREHGLRQGLLSAVWRGERPHHKNWRALKE